MPDDAQGMIGDVKGGEYQMEETISQDGYPTLESVQPTQDTLFTLADFTIKGEQSLQQMKEEYKDMKKQLKSLYEASPTYREEAEKIKTLKKNLDTVKQGIEQQPDVSTLVNTIKGLRDDIKDRKDQISFSALEYAKASGETHIEKEGFVWDIIRIAKLARRSY
jgi:uncharacterized coiled-coil DUF342 family protein